uniref:EIF-4F 25 kDa subunit n=1 Tax=Parascaris univalens TaxID=6257 RepID=A0A914ZYG2_PARUN
MEQMHTHQQNKHVISPRAVPETHTCSQMDHIILKLKDSENQPPTGNANHKISWEATDTCFGRPVSQIAPANILQIYVNKLSEDAFQSDY